MSRVPSEHHRLGTGSRLRLRSDAQRSRSEVIVVQVKDGLIWISGVDTPGGAGERVTMEHLVAGDARYFAPARVEFVPPETYALRRIGEWQRHQRRADVRISTHGIELQIRPLEAVWDTPSEEVRIPLLDVSAGGAAARVSSELELGDAVLCSFELPGEKRFDLPARVARVGRPGKHSRRRLIGFEFQRVDDEQRAALLRWIYREQTRRHREMKRQGAGSA